MNISRWLENLDLHSRKLLMLAAALASALTVSAQVASVSSFPITSGTTGISNVVSTNGSLWFISSIDTGGGVGVYQYYIDSTTPAGATTSYSLANVPSPVGQSITLGPDGALWFTAGSYSSAVIGRITTSGSISTFSVSGNPYGFSSGPGAIASGSDGALWFTDSSASQIGRVTTAGSFSYFQLSNPAFGITNGPDGNIWVTEYTRNAVNSSGSYYWTGQVASVTPAGVETTYDIPQVRVVLPTYVEAPVDTFATGTDGALWFTEYSGTQVGRVTTSGVVTTVYSNPANGITAGPDGALWLTQPGASVTGAPTSGPALIRLLTDTTTSSYALSPSVFSDPNGIAAGPDSALWFNDAAISVIARAVLQLSITTTTLPNGSAGATYPSTTLQAQLGTQPYSWSVPPTSLPPGLALSAAGVLSGTPTTSGAYTFTVTVTDSASSPQTATASYSITIAPGAPASVVATSGTPQSAPINTVFGQPLVATVLDANGNPVPNAAVIFAAPASGASGTFAGAANTVTVAANTAGVATAPAFTANGTAAGYTVSAAVAGAASAASFTLTNTAGSAASITMTSGSGQTAAINTAFGSPLVATVQDVGGNPVAGITVTFTAPPSGASATFTGGATTFNVLTNASGVAALPAVTANATAGSYSVTASVPGVATPAAFALTNSVGTAGAITATAGSGQSAPIDTSFASPLSAKVTDSGGNAIANATVTFTAPGSGASGTFAGGAATTTAATNSSGVATSPAFTANARAGSYTVTASVAGVNTPAAFTLTNTVGSAASITAISGGGQSTPVNTTFAAALAALVKDSGGNPVAGATVIFLAPGSGAGGTFTGASVSVTTTTNSAGIATSSSFVANGNAGGYFVTAAVAGVAASASYSLTNTAGPPASVTVVSGSPQSVQINNTFGNLVVLVKDASANPVANVNVTFVAPGSGASGIFSGAGTSATVATGPSGTATSPAFTANATAGAYGVNASVAGVGTPATFALTNTAGSPASITAASGGGQSATVLTAFGAALVASVKDSGGNPVANASVTFTAAPSGASGSFAGGGLTVTLPTNASGVATAPTFSANGTAGIYNVSAAVTGVGAQAIFPLTNNAAAASVITVSPGSGGQFAQINTQFATPLVVSVTDANNNPVANVRVTFTAPGSGASCTFGGGGSAVSVTTNSSGLATTLLAPAKANATAGAYTVTVSAAGVASAASLILTNSAGAPGSIVMTSGSGQFARVGTVFANPLVVTVTDSNGNLVSNATVTFTAQTTGASATFAGAGTTSTATTNSSGMATSPTLTANDTAGSYSVTASVPGAASPVTFILNNSAGTAASIAATTGTPQSARTNSAFNNFLVVTVKDASGNPVGGVSVTYTAPGSGASGTFPGNVATATAMTNSSGVAVSPTFTANATTGNYIVAGTVSGVSSAANFTLTNVAGLTITTPATLPAGTAGLQYSVILSTVAGTPPYTWSLSHGTLPTGLTLNATTGQITGMPTASGTYPFTVTVKDSSTPPQTASQAFSLLINVPGPTITTPTPLTPGIAGIQYSQTLTGVGGKTPYTWQVSTGTLPVGLTLNSSTGAISGIPTVPNTYSFTVTLTDSSTPPQITSQAFSLLINPGSQPVAPAFTFNGIPTTLAAGAVVTKATIELSGPSSSAYLGTLTLGFTPNPTYAGGLQDGYTGDASFVDSSGTKFTSESVPIPAMTTSVPLPNIDPGTVAGEVTINLAVPAQNGATATITVPAAAPTIEANSVQITNITATGFNVELVATSTTREATNATFTFTAAAGASLTGTTSFTVDVSSLLSGWFSGASSLPYGGAFTLTIPFSLTGSSTAIQSVSVTLANSIGTSAPVSGIQ
jgi:streptogramin lyase